MPLASLNHCSLECPSMNAEGRQVAAVWPCGETTLLLLSQSSSVTLTFCSQQWSSGQSEENSGPSHCCQNKPDKVINHLSMALTCKKWINEIWHFNMIEKQQLCNILTLGFCLFLLITNVRCRNTTRSKCAHRGRQNDRHCYILQ